MARLAREHKEEHLNHLRELMTKKFAQNIRNASDCALLADDIEAVTGNKVSTDTLRRLFRVVRSVSQPSPYTLDVCAMYVGYTNWQDVITDYAGQNTLYLKTLLLDVGEAEMGFDELRGRLQHFTRSKEWYEAFNQILLLKFQKEDKIFFDRIFEIKCAFDYSEDFKYEIYHLVHMLGLLCNQSKWLAEIAVRKYYNLPYESDYFVEWLVVPQYEYYHQLLENYYASKGGVESVRLFYHLIKGTHHAETGQIESFYENFRELKAVMKSKTDAGNNILTMRYLGLQLFAEYIGQNTASLKSLKKDIFLNGYVNHKDSGHRVSSIFIICQYLFMMHEYDWMVRLYEEKVELFPNILGYWAELNLNQLNVYYSYALIKIDRREKAKEIFSGININKFDLNFKSKITPVYKELEADLTM